ncbi:hypothetical protein GGF31_002124 [Allomyces arbusculus]|nr:hypothetical protein GGF31_002124 [Allomyces arbusculus]
MSTAAVATALPIEAVLVPPLALVDGTVDNVQLADSTPTDVALAAHALIVQAAQNEDKVDEVALTKLVELIGERTKDLVSRDSLMAHMFLLAAFHHQMRHEDEAKDLALLCCSEARYLAFMDALAQAVSKDASIVENPPLPPLDVAMFWHSHMLSPIRYVEDMQRRYGRTVVRINFPLLRLAKTLMGDLTDLDTAREFWAAHMPADQPFDLTPATIDEAKVTDKVQCPSCKNEQAMTMAEYASFRLHAQAHSCTSCNAAFTAEHVAVRRFLMVAACAPLARIAGTQTHPKTRMLVGKEHVNMADVAALFDKTTWAKHANALPTLSTWSDIQTLVFEPVMAAAADKLVLPGNKRRLGMVLHAHRDVTTGPWSMDMIRAVRRQRRFSAKIAKVVSAGLHAVYHHNTTALAQYPKFLAAMVATRPKTTFVPTMAIDLAWHTHQLSPMAYTMQTCAIVGHVVNHNDSDDEISEARIATGTKAMPALWMDLYSEDYYQLNVSCTTGAKYKATTAFMGVSSETHEHQNVAACWWSDPGCNNYCGGCGWGGGPCDDEPW